MKLQRELRILTLDPPLPLKITKTQSFYIFSLTRMGNPARLQIRAAYDEYLSSIFKAEIIVNRAILVLAFSRPKNIRDFETKAKLHQAQGQSASTIMRKYRAGLNPF